MTLVLDRILDEADLVRLAEIVQLKLRAGDCILLAGDLGQGKTTFARALVRAALDDPAADVPSPTFSLLQTYVTPRFEIAHVDLYRLDGPGALDELALDEHLARGVTLIEWPERAAGRLPGDCIEIALADAGPARRHVRMSAHDNALARMIRAAEIFAFCAIHTGPVAGRVRYMQGDASLRSYARIAGGKAPLILMDAPRQPNGPPIRDGRTYSDISKLAEDVRPFVAIAAALRGAGLSAPEITAADLDRGLLLVEDLGTCVFGHEMLDGTPQAELWQAAVDALVHLRRVGLPKQLSVGDGTTYALPRRDRAAFEIEVGLLLDWYWPLVKGAPAPELIRREFLTLWSPVIDRLLALAPGVFLRDYISPNLVWLAERSGIARVGMLDFQDAQAEHWAFDVVSLLQDARVDVPLELERRLFAGYCAAIEATEPAFDRGAFAAAYADFGAQRNTRIVGLWARMHKRDGFAHYLQLLPRTWEYLERDLAHPALADLAHWFDRHFPQDVRKRPIQA